MSRALHFPQDGMCACAASDVSDQPAHPHSLIKIIAHSVSSQGPKASSGGQRRLWSDCADAQADLSLRWAHIQYSRKCCAPAQFNLFHCLYRLCRAIKRLSHIELIKQIRSDLVHRSNKHEPYPNCWVMFVKFSKIRCFLVKTDYLKQ